MTLSPGQLIKYKFHPESSGVLTEAQAVGPEFIFSYIMTAGPHKDMHVRHIRVTKDEFLHNFLVFPNNSLARKLYA